MGLSEHITGWNNEHGVLKLFFKDCVKHVQLYMCKVILVHLCYWQINNMNQRTRWEQKEFQILLNFFSETRQVNKINDSR